MGLTNRPAREDAPRPTTRRRPAPWSLPFVLAALALHGVAIFTLAELTPYFEPKKESRRRPVSLVIMQPPEPKEEEEPEEEEPEDKGQLVEVAPPEEEERPEDADYLAEHNQKVEEETRSAKFKVNPEILAKEYSDEEKMQMEDLVDVNVDKPSTGATVGNHRFDPDRHGSLASLPSPWKVTNKDGSQDPVPSSHTSSAIAGAPSNDMLNEKRSDQVNLNTKEFLYAGYINRIRRLVNFYWVQNIDNRPRSVVISKPNYDTVVSVVLNSDGALEHIEVVEPSGVEFLDDAVIQAFRMAGPFPNPPEGLIAKDGRVYLGNMGFTVQFGQARAQFQGVDPRAGVQFPGILKSPR